MSVVQFINPDLRQLIKGEFQARSEKQFALANTISTFLAFPGLVGFWPMSSIDAANNGNVFDISGNGRTLTNNNTVVANRDGLIPYMQFTAANSEYLERADEAGLDITGNEAYIADNGLTVGGWVWFDSNTGSNQAVITKRLLSQPDISFYIVRSTSADQLLFAVSSGASITTTINTQVTNDSQWYYVVGRYIPSTSVDTFVLSSTQTEASNATGIATISNSAAPLRVGARGDGAIYMDGRVSMLFLCASALSDTIIYNSFYQSRVLFGV